MVGILLLSFLALQGMDWDGLSGGEGHHDFGSFSWLFRLWLFSRCPVSTILFVSSFDIMVKYSFHPVRIGHEARHISVLMY